MSDLISREAAIKMFQEKAQGYVVSMFATMTECNIAKIVAMECANELNGLPVIDAEPVKHGKWYWQEEATYNPTEPTEYNSYWTCSACGEDIADYLDHALPSSFIFLDSPDYEPTMEYCPHCGAKMDLEDDDE